MKSTFAFLILVPAAFAVCKCAFAPAAIAFAPSLIDALKPIIQSAANKAEAKGKAQTALNLLQDVNNGEFPSEFEINSALALAGKQCLKDAEYVQIKEALTPAFQQLVLDAQSQPGGLQLVKKRVSDAIVATQWEIGK